MSTGFHGLDPDISRWCVASTRSGVDDLREAEAIIDELFVVTPDAAFAAGWLGPARDGVAADVSALSATADTLDHAVDAIVAIDNSWQSQGPMVLHATGRPVAPPQAGEPPDDGTPEGWVVALATTIAHVRGGDVHIWIERIHTQIRHAQQVDLTKVSHTVLFEIVAQLGDGDDLGLEQRLVLFAALEELAHRLDPAHERYDSMLTLDQLLLQHTGHDSDDFMVLFTAIARLLDESRGGEKLYILETLAAQLAPFVDLMAHNGHAEWLLDLMNSTELVLLFEEMMPELSDEAVAAVGALLVKRGDLDASNNPRPRQFLQQIAATRPDAALLMLETPATRELLLAEPDHDTTATRDLLIAALFESRESNPDDESIQARTALLMADIAALAGTGDLNDNARRAIASSTLIYVDEWTDHGERHEHRRVSYRIGDAAIDIAMSDLELLLGQLAADKGDPPDVVGARDILTNVAGLYHETKMLQAVDDKRSNNPNEYDRFQTDVEYHVEHRAQKLEAWIVSGHQAYNRDQGLEYDEAAATIDDIYGKAEAPIIAAGTAIGSTLGPGGTAVGSATGKAVYEGGRAIIDRFAKGDPPEPLAPDEFSTALDYYKRNASMQVWVVNDELAAEVGLSDAAREELGEIVELHERATTQEDWDDYHQRISAWEQRDDVPSEVVNSLRTRWDTSAM